MLGVCCITYCLLIERTDILFNELFDKFSATFNKQAGFAKKEEEEETRQEEEWDGDGCGLFLELLEPFILSNQLTVLPPEITQLFVQHYAHKAAQLTTTPVASHNNNGSTETATQSSLQQSPAPEHLQQRQRNILQRVQKCILHLDISTIDFHQVQGSCASSVTCCYGCLCHFCY
jgi:hypothetical protein